MSDETPAPAAMPEPVRGERLPILPHNWVTALIGILVVPTVVVAGGTVIGLGVPNKAFSTVVMGVTIVALAVVVYTLCMRRLRGSDLGFVRGGSLRAIVFGALAAVVFNVIVFVAGKIDPELVDASDTVLKTLGFGETVFKDVMLCLSIVVLAPLWEEIVFRGVAFRSVRDALFRRWPRVGATLVAMALSSFAFMSAHGGEGQDKQLPYLFLLGVLLAASYVYTGTLLAPLVLHSVNNTYAMISQITTTNFELAGGMSPWIMLAGPPVTIALYFVIGAVYRVVGSSGEKASASISTK